MKTTAELLAEFQARGGKVRKVAVGANSGISDRQFYLASRGDISLKGPSDNELIDQRHVRGNAVVNGLGELIAVEGR